MANITGLSSVPTFVAQPTVPAATPDTAAQLDAQAQADAQAAAPTDTFVAGEPSTPDLLKTSLSGPGSHDYTISAIRLDPTSETGIITGDIVGGHSALPVAGGEGGVNTWGGSVTAPDPVASPVAGGEGGIVSTGGVAAGEGGVVSTGGVTGGEGGVISAGGVTGGEGGVVSSGGVTGGEGGVVSAPAVITDVAAPVVGGEA